MSAGVQRRRFRSTAFGILVLGGGLWLVLLWNLEPARAPELVLSRAGPAGTTNAAGPEPGHGSGTVPDDLRRKHDPRVRVSFWLSCTQDVAIFVSATGVQVPTGYAWRTEMEDLRGSIWRLKAGIPQEVCVPRPESPAWRTFIRCGVEMKGWRLLKAQLREAWILRSFSQWSGKAWGGGRWSGEYEILSPEILE